MTNLCGHDRDVLRWALELWATVTNGGMVVYSAGTGGAKVAKANAFGDANDPAKLAEMLAAVDHNHEFVISGDTIERCKWGRGKRLVTLNIWTMAEARGELLRILTTDHVDPDELLNTIPLHERAESRRFDPDPDRGE